MFHSLGALTSEPYFLTALEAGSLRARCRQGWAPSEASLCGLWMSVLLLSSRGPPSTCACVLISPQKDRHQSIWIRAHRVTCVNLISSSKTILQIPPHSEVLEVRTSTCVFGGETTAFNSTTLFFLRGLKLLLNEFKGWIDQLCLTQLLMLISVK